MIFLIFIFILVGLIARNLLMSPILFYDWDEGMYAQIAREIIKNKSLFTTFNGYIWLDKPPLIHSLITGIFSFFGESEFWSRMIMVVIAFMLIILTYSLAKKITKKNKKASILSVLVLAASPIFLERATMLNSDTIIAVSWLGYFLFWDKYWPKLFFLTIGVWSKSILGLYPLFIEISYCLFELTVYRKKIRFTLNSLFKYSLLFIIPSLWYIAGIVKFGYFFIENHFLSQVFKRLYVPIELHFGGKFFYLNYLWDNLGLINVIFVVAYLIVAYKLVKDFRQKKSLTAYLSLLSPLPFLAFLTIMKTKITWYVVIFLPFLTLLVSYLHANIKNTIFKYAIFFGVIVYFISNFARQTFLLKTDYAPSDKIKLAQCLSKDKNIKMAFLVDKEERKIRNFLEAAHYDTTSSFYYGGSPSFVYYSKKQVDYYYNISDFIKKINLYHIFALSKTDVANNTELQLLFNTKKIYCHYGDWISIVK